MKFSLLILPIALVTLLLLFGCVSPSTNNQTPINFQTIEKGVNSNIKDRGAFVIDNEKDWEAFFVQLKGITSIQLKQIDFSKETVIAVFSGEKPTGGYSIGVTSIKFISPSIKPGDIIPINQLIVNLEFAQEGYLDVLVTESFPNQGDIVTQATTSPYHIVKIPKQLVSNYFIRSGSATLPIISFTPVSNNSETVWMSIEPKQCNSNPWDSLNFPTEKEKILNFFSANNITILDYLDRPISEVVCDACSCPKGNQILVKMNTPIPVIPSGNNSQTTASITITNFITSLGFKKVTEPIIFTDKLSYTNAKIDATMMDANGNLISEIRNADKIKITILNPTNGNIFLGGCGQYGYYSADSRETSQTIPEIKQFKVCVWEGNAFEIKAGEFSSFEEELLPANAHDYETYYLRSGYKSNCDETALPKPASQLNCSNEKTIDSLGFKVVSGEKITQTIPADLNVTLQRGACFGTCPKYSINLKANTTVGDKIITTGTVTYDGKQFVCVKGIKYSYNLPQNTLQQLVSEINKANFFSLNERYDVEQATDLPNATITVTMNGQTKTIYHYYGDFSAPEGLTQLEDKIDALLNSNQWIKDTQGNSCSTN